VHAKPLKCAKAAAKLTDLHNRITKLDARLAVLQSKLTSAQNKGRSDLALTLQARIAASQKRHDHLESLVAQITSTCPS
jgi:hypothetical protein